MGRHLWSYWRHWILQWNQCNRPNQHHFWLSKHRRLQDELEHITRYLPGFIVHVILRNWVQINNLNPQYVVELVILNYISDVLGVNRDTKVDLINSYLCFIGIDGRLLEEVYPHLYSYESFTGIHDSHATIYLDSSQYGIYKGKRVHVLCHSRWMIQVHARACVCHGIT